MTNKNYKSDIYIYVGNHGKREGIEDFISILQDVLINNGCDSKVSTSLHAGVTNIIIDEFTNYSQNRIISEFKKDNPETVLVLVLTEFVEKKYLVSSFNNFGGIVDSALVSFLNIIIRKLRDDYIAVKVKDWLLMLLYLPVTLTYGISISLWYLCLILVSQSKSKIFFTSIKKRLYKLAYLHMRFLGLEKFIKYADMVILSHELIETGLVSVNWLKKSDPKNIGVLYPEFDIEAVLAKLFVEKSLYIEISGSVTAYRKMWIGKIGRMLSRYGLNNSIGSTKTISFDASTQPTDMERAAYSLHPPQKERWLYSSPTRLYRALHIDGNIPVITDYFGQHPIEDICIKFNGLETLISMMELYNNRDAAIDFLKPKIIKYNSIIKKRNIELVRRLKCEKHIPI